MASQVSVLKLFDLVQSHRVTAVIYVAVKLGIAELLRGGPQTLGQLAKATGAHERSLGRLLTVLSTIGICERTGQGSYALTEVGAGLDGEAEQSFKGWAIFEAEMLSKRWSGMLKSVMTGKTAAELQGLADSFELMGRTPENVAKFNAAMTELTRLVMPDILRAYDFSGISHLMDVGGGSGELLGAIAQQNRKLRGTVFDLPRCADAAGKHLQQIGISDRVEFVAGDFFKSVPAVADAIILKSMIHDWNDARSISILRNCRSRWRRRQVAAGRTTDAGNAGHGRRRQGACDERSEHDSRSRRQRAHHEAIPRIARTKRLRTGCGSSGRPLQCDRGASCLRKCRVRGCNAHPASGLSRKRTPCPSGRCSGNSSFSAQ